MKPATHPDAATSGLQRCIISMGYDIFTKQPKQLPTEVNTVSLETNSGSHTMGHLHVLWPANIELGHRWPGLTLRYLERVPRPLVLQRRLATGKSSSQAKHIICTWDNVSTPMEHRLNSKICHSGNTDFGILTYSPSVSAH